MLRLATNESPYGPFPGAQEAIAECVTRIARYPEPDTEPRPRHGPGP